MMKDSVTGDGGDDKVVGANDPYAELDWVGFRLSDPVDGEEGLSKEEQVPLQIDTDVPEGFVVDDLVWNKLQELRNEKVESTSLSWTARQLSS
jgi:hypothetical protein